MQFDLQILKNNYAGYLEQKQINYELKIHSF